MPQGSIPSLNTSVIDIEEAQNDKSEVTHEIKLQDRNNGSMAQQFSEYSLLLQMTVFGSNNPCILIHDCLTLHFQGN